MSSDLLPSAQSLLSQRHGHKRLKLGDCIDIKGTKASFESGKSNVEVVVAPATATFYIYLDKVKLAASISSSSLQTAAADGIWITVLADHRRAYMEVTWTPPVNGGSNFAAIIKLKGPDRKKELSPDESESDDEEVGLGKYFQIAVNLIDGTTQSYTVTANTTVFELKQMVERDDQIPIDESKLFYRNEQMEDYKTLGQYGFNGK
ncbi:hypothetical protein PoB_005888100 [Plakobranchus ocellatus]|uniref:Ubiquitin-like domain-containing protein n=1 Tax=Plakobranchus ocellatus TaxID=259542 RepID=A0AAV4CHQ7_9GAST|nr:hypothetical protein PoB_005888100 [Plakobranchus ocellatus]